MKNVVIKASLKSVWKSVLITNLYAIVIALLNYFLKANYLYICHKPGGPTLLNYMRSWSYYIISMEALMFVIYFFHICLSGNGVNNGIMVILFIVAVNKL